MQAQSQPTELCCEVQGLRIFRNIPFALPLICPKQVVPDNRDPRTHRSHHDYNLEHDV